MQGPPPLSGPDLRLGLLRLFPPPVLEDRDGAQEDRVVALNALDVDLEQFGRRHVALADEGRQPVHREEGDLLLARRHRPLPGLELDRRTLERIQPGAPVFLEKRAGSARIRLELEGRRLAVPEGDRLLLRSFLRPQPRGRAGSADVSGSSGHQRPRIQRPGRRGRRSDLQKAPPPNTAVRGLSLRSVARSVVLLGHSRLLWLRWADPGSARVPRGLRLRRNAPTDNPPQGRAEIEGEVASPWLTATLSPGII